MSNDEKLNPKNYRNLTLAPGFAVALTLRNGTAPFRTCTGKIQAVDSNGVRITLLDWVDRSFTGDDLYAPWRNIDSALIATPEHDMPMFIDSAVEWERQMHSEPPTE